ncbi:MAG: hypothetical protein LBV18_02115, partial [Alistipes sp.]|nr:hypothetical protein [Alistipes sp.]
MAIERTRLKLAVSEETNELIWFVTRNSTTRKLRGVDEQNGSPKKICVLSEDLKGVLRPGIVYDVELKPMRTGNGYVVISAIRPKFKAEIETVVIPRNVYQLRITFGHKIIYFDPKDEPHRRRGREGVARQAGPRRCGRGNREV